MIRQCVFVRLSPGTSETAWLEVMSGLERLVADLPGGLAIQWSGNVSPEVGMDKGFSHGFAIDFTDAAARDEYLSDPRHVALGDQLLRMARDGGEGVFVFDLE
jgi:hypothetical protein